MKAAILREFKQPLAIEEIPKPVPGADEVLIQVEACGVCHSDLHVADGDWSQFAGIVKRPVVLGHEVVGRVVEKGADVRELRVGERVGVAWIHWTCGRCEQCSEGRENLCRHQLITGVMVDGGYAEFLKAKASHALRVPEGLNPAEAAPLFCAGVTVYRAIKNADVAPGARLAVFGIGGLGHLAVQVGRAFGAEVFAIDIADEKLKLAAACGAAQTLNAATTDVIAALQSKGGVHVALVASAAKAAYDMAFYSLRPAGSLVVVGLPAENIAFPPTLMAAGEVRILASAVGTRQDLRDVLEMAAAGKVRCQMTSRPLEKVNETLEEMRRAQIAGRVVLTPR